MWRKQLIIVSLLTLVSITIVGRMLVFMAQRLHCFQFINADDNLIWWTRPSLYKLYLWGLIFTGLFIALFYLVVHYMASSAYDNASSIDQVFARMDFERRTLNHKRLEVNYFGAKEFEQLKNKSDEDEEEKAVFDEVVKLKSFYNTFALNFTAEEFSEDAAYDPSIERENINAKNIRERFLSSFLVDASPEIMVQNPHRMMEDVVSEKIFPIEACRNASGILLVLWAKGYGGSAFDEWNPDNSDSSGICSNQLSFEGISQLDTCDVGGAFKCCS